MFLGYGLVNPQILPRRNLPVCANLRSCAGRRHALTRKCDSDHGSSRHYFNQVNRDYKTKILSKEFRTHFVDTLQFKGEHVKVRNDGAFNFSSEEN
jgi:hypothetical protein